MAATLRHPPEQDTAAPCAAPDISEIPSTIDPITWVIPTVSSTTVASDSPSSPILLPALSSVMTTAEPHSFVQSAPIEPVTDRHCGAC